MRKIKYSLALNPAVVNAIDFFAKSQDMSRSAAVNEILYNFCIDRYGFLNDICNCDNDVEGQEVFE